ncbi:MAG TPA: hypothetical protein DD624_07735 [Alphaproteobacteria bacterium]|nr:hypothetical protein [Alphaproteobacteria bacterium]
MKFIFSFCRAFMIFFIWTFGFSFWFQRLMLAGWRFNPFDGVHWHYLQRQWQSGWTITSLREWLFVLLLFAAIPVWLTGWAVLTTVAWKKWFKVILMFPLKLAQKMWKKHKENRAQTVRPKITKRKSYKQTRPAAVRASTGRIAKVADKEAAQEKEKEKEKEQQKAHSHSHKEHKPAPEPAPKKEKAAQPAAAAAASGDGSIGDALRSAGYKLLQDVKIAGKAVDFIGMCADHLLLCLVDSENGDWLADEERFNDEEPLWFSESNHRISPVRVVLNARDALLPMLSGAARGMEIKPMVVINQGTIINAEDMFEVWDNLKVSVCRHGAGGPDEIKMLENALSKVKAPDDAVVRDVSGLLS